MYDEVITFADPLYPSISEDRTACAYLSLSIFKVVERMSNLNLSIAFCLLADLGFWSEMAEKSCHEPLSFPFLTSLAIHFAFAGTAVLCWGSHSYCDNSLNTFSWYWGKFETSYTFCAHISSISDLEGMKSLLCTSVKCHACLTNYLSA